MNQAVINIKIDQKVKTQAQKVAADLGLSLSSLLNAYLRQVIRTKEVSFRLEEKPSARLIKSIEEAEKGIKAGKLKAYSSIEEIRKEMER